MNQEVKIELFRSAAVGEWYWRTRCHENGNILGGSSEGYVNRSHAIAMIVKHFGPDAQFDEVGE